MKLAILMRVLGWGVMFGLLGNPAWACIVLGCIMVATSLYFADR